MGHKDVIIGLWDACIVLAVGIFQMTNVFIVDILLGIEPIIVEELSKKTCLLGSLQLNRCLVSRITNLLSMEKILETSAR